MKILQRKKENGFTRMESLLFFIYIILFIISCYLMYRKGLQIHTINNKDHNLESFYLLLNAIL